VKTRPRSRLGAPVAHELDTRRVAGYVWGTLRSSPDTRRALTPTFALGSVQARPTGKSRSNAYQLKGDKTVTTMKRIYVLGVTILAAATASHAGEPLNIYILAGQSNMQGQARLSTMPRMAMDPKTKPLHDKIIDQDGTPRVYDDVRVAALTGGRKVVPRYFVWVTGAMAGSSKSSFPYKIATTEKCRPDPRPLVLVRPVNSVHGLPAHVSPVI
jgi:hypothetical protein